MKNMDAYSRREQVRILEHMAFDFYVRKGIVPREIGVLQKAVATAPLGFKFNPNHDELGRFTFGSSENDEDAPPSATSENRVVQEVPPIIEEMPADLPGMNGNPLPKNPSDLLDQGYEEISHPEAAAAGHRTFQNPETGDVLRFDEGDPDAEGFEGQDHYHRLNPDQMNRQNRYLDQNGNPVPKGTKPSHLLPRETT